MPTKKELREIVRQRKSLYSERELKAWSRLISDKILRLPQVQEAHVVMLYCSLPDEVDTHEMIKYLNGKGKKILLPAVISDTEMELRLYESDDDLQIGKFNITEPIGKAFNNVEEIDVMIIPGMGFDRQGNRLGRGKGYYDRFLRLAPKIFKVGVCFHFQVFEQVPTDKHDIRMDTVVSIEPEV